MVHMTIAPTTMTLILSTNAATIHNLRVKELKDLCSIIINIIPQVS